MKIKSLIVVVSLILSSCASTFQYNKIAQPNSNDKEMATIYVLRPSSFGSAIKFGIYCLFRSCWGRDFGVIGPIISLFIGPLSDYNNIQFI